VTLLIGLLASPSSIAWAQPQGAERQSWERAGLRVLTSVHLTLVTDLPSTPEVDELPIVFEQAVGCWTRFFRVDPERLSDWHVTGSLMVDRQRFRQVGLLPATLPDFPFGYQQGRQLWLDEQPTAYYRRHLLLHEGTHAVVRQLTGTQGPPWYIEGLAELLATHRWQAGQLEMNVVPQSRDDVPMWGRIKVLRDAAASGQLLSFAEVAAFDDRAHRQLAPYAWSWAALLLLEHHPNYRGAGELRNHLRLDSAAFWDQLLRSLGPSAAHLEADWQMMLREIDYGYSAAQGAIAHQPHGRKSSAGWIGPIQAARSWQATGWHVPAERPVSITAEGRISLGREPRSWDSEPPGITVEYYQGRPLGELVAVVLLDEPDQHGQRWSDVRPVGRHARLSWPGSGQLYLRVNERPGALDDNTGEFAVRLGAD
jgi:hypothetical protein